MKLPDLIFRRDTVYVDTRSRVSLEQHVHTPDNGTYLRGADVVMRRVYGALLVAVLVVC